MTTDKQKLRALANAMIPGTNESEATAIPQALEEFLSAVTPEKIIALLDEITQLTKENANLREDRDALLAAGGHAL